MADLLKFSLLLTSLTIPLAAYDFGNHGKTYPIEEEDLITYIQNQILSLDNQTFSAIQEKLREEYTKHFHEPASVHGICRATEYEVHYFDPTIVTKKDIKDQNGKVIIPKGTSYNPLDHLSLTEDLLFFDGDQEDQIQWAKSFGDHTKWILVNGKPLELESQENRPVFFDQCGVLSKKLSIKSVPARITQEKKILKIEHIPLEEMTCAS